MGQPYWTYIIARTNIPQDKPVDIANGKAGKKRKGRDNKQPSTEPEVDIVQKGAIRKSSNDVHPPSKVKRTKAVSSTATVAESVSD